MDMTLGTEILKLDNCSDEIFPSSGFYINYWLQ